MVTRRRTVRRPAGNALRPRLTWRAFEHEGFTIVGGTTKIVNMTVDGVSPTLSALGVQGDYTIRRVRASLALWDTDIETTQRFVTVYWGMTIVSVDAEASGSGALADPRTDSADWFGYGTAMYPVVPTVSGAPSAQGYRWFDIDVRSMRKVNENSQVAVMLLNMVAGENALYQVAGRMLVSHGRA